jgi:hypothetical protein
MYNPRLRVHLIDTPGFDDTNKKDVEVLRDIAGWLGVTYRQKILLSGLIYLHPISDNRLRGSALRNLFMFKKLCGPDCLPGIVLATTMWGLVSAEDGIRRESQLRATNDFWGEMEKGGSRVMRHLRTKESAMTILSVILESRHPMLLKIQDEMINEGLGLEDTGAGIKVNQDLIEADRKHKAELAALREDMKVADEASKREIAELMRKQQVEIEENEKQRKKLEINMAKLEEDRARDLKELQEQLAQQATNLREREREITKFRDDMSKRDAADTLSRGEREQLRKKLLAMEQENANEVKKLKLAVEQAQRRTGTHDIETKLSLTPTQAFGILLVML